MVNTSQQVGGSIGTALLNTLAATAAADYLAAHAPVTEAVGAQAAIASYARPRTGGARASSPLEPSCRLCCSAGEDTDFH